MAHIFTNFADIWHRLTGPTRQSESKLNEASLAPVEPIVVFDKSSSAAEVRNAERINGKTPQEILKDLRETSEVRQDVDDFRAEWAGQLDFRAEYPLISDRAIEGLKACRDAIRSTSGYETSVVVGGSRIKIKESDLSPHIGYSALNPNLEIAETLYFLENVDNRNTLVISAVGFEHVIGYYFHGPYSIEDVLGVLGIDGPNRKVSN